MENSPSQKKLLYVIKTSHSILSQRESPSFTKPNGIILIYSKVGWNMSKWKSKIYAGVFQSIPLFKSKMGFLQDDIYSESN